mmetsp:Transcript_41239/g.93269  ORF Transcript_41239/g.93269 Transcript_41239/m.93269 type:complete len:306 (-) Transcript_41239:1029-1946(-)
MVPGVVVVQIRDRHRGSGIALESAAHSTGHPRAVSAPLHSLVGYKLLGRQHLHRHHPSAHGEYHSGGPGVRLGHHGPLRRGSGHGQAHPVLQVHHAGVRDEDRGGTHLHVPSALLELHGGAGGGVRPVVRCGDHRECSRNPGGDGGVLPLGRGEGGVAGQGGDFLNVIVPTALGHLPVPLGVAPRSHGVEIAPGEHLVHIHREAILVRRAQRLAPRPRQTDRVVVHAAVPPGGQILGALTVAVVTHARLRPAALGQAGVDGGPGDIRGGDVVALAVLGVVGVELDLRGALHHVVKCVVPGQVVLG